MTRPVRANNTAAYDFAPTPCTRSYGVASVPRSGSTLLCRALWELGVAGAPKEYFNPVQRRELEQRLGAGSAADYLDALLRIRTSPNGVFGWKAHFNHFRSQVLEPGLLERLPDPRFVKIVRRDRLGQAISFVRAQQTGQWTSEQRAHRAPRFDAARIAAALGKITHEDQAWESFFARRGIVPLRLTYEGFVAQYEDTVRRVLEHLGIAGDHAVPPPRLQRQRDEISESWRRRYLADHAAPPGAHP